VPQFATSGFPVPVLLTYFVIFGKIVRFETVDAA